MMRILILSLLLSAQPAFAEGFRTVSSRDGFLRLVEGRKLKQFLISMRFDDLGQIKGWAWGRPVLGNWYWQDRRLCKRVFFGTTDKGEFCVQVRSDGHTVLFIPKKGEGKIEEFTLK